MANKGVYMMKQIFVYEGKVIHGKQRHFLIRHYLMKQTFIYVRTK